MGSKNFGKKRRSFGKRSFGKKRRSFGKRSFGKKRRSFGKKRRSFGRRRRFGQVGLRERIVSFYQTIPNHGKTDADFDYFVQWVNENDETSFNSLLMEKYGKDLNTQIPPAI